VPTEAKGGRLITKELIEVLKVEAGRMAAEPFRVQSTETELDLSNNKVSHFDLPSYSCLKTLNLSSNRLSTFCLSNNKSLE
jgi:Leucine-rich repeat (LRR) protein